jgi:hypothetical protein
MNDFERTSDIANIIKGIGNVDSLTSEGLVRICRSLYKQIEFCGGYNIPVSN